MLVDAAGEDGRIRKAGGGDPPHRDVARVRLHLDEREEAVWPQRREEEGEVAAAGAKLYDARAWLEEGKHVRRDASELLPLAERAVGA